MPPRAAPPRAQRQTRRCEEAAEVNARSQTKEAKLGHPALTGGRGRASWWLAGRLDKEGTCVCAVRGRDSPRWSQAGAGVGPSRPALPSAAFLSRFAKFDPEGLCRYLQILSFARPRKQPQGKRGQHKEEERSMRGSLARLPGRDAFAGLERFRRGNVFQRG